MTGAFALSMMSVVAAPHRVLAYPPPGATATLQALACTAPPPGKTCELTFTEVDANGKPIAGDSVSWAVSAASKGAVSPATSVTDAGGVASAVFTAGPGCGAVTITGSSARSSAQTVITVACGPAVVPSAPGGGNNSSLAVVVGGLLAAAVAATLCLMGFRRWRHGVR